MHHGNLAKIIKNYIGLSPDIKEIHPKLMYQALTELYTLRYTLYKFISKVLMVCKHLNFVPQEDVSELFESFHNSSEFLFYHCVI